MPSQWRGAFRIFRSLWAASGALSLLGVIAVASFDHLQEMVNSQLRNRTYVELQRQPLNRDAEINNAAARTFGSNQQYMASEKSACGGQPREKDNSPNLPRTVVTLEISAGESLPDHGNVIKFEAIGNDVVGAVFAANHSPTVCFGQNGRSVDITMPDSWNGKRPLVAMLVLEGIVGEYRIHGFQDRTSKMAQMGLLVAVFFFVLGGGLALLSLSTLVSIKEIDKKNLSQDDRLAAHGNALDDIRYQLVLISHILQKVHPAHAKEVAEFLRQLWELNAVADRPVEDSELVNPTLKSERTGAPGAAKGMMDQWYTAGGPEGGNAS